MHIRQFVQRIVSALIYPTKKGDWYKNKGYGSDKTNPFDDFIATGQGESTTLPHLQRLNARRGVVEAEMTNHRIAKLETVTLTPNFTTNDLSGHNKHIIYFFGRSEPLEVKFHELSTDAVTIGCTVHAFNLPGMHHSTCRMYEFNDCVNCGIAQINQLLKQNIHPSDIILKGYDFGESVATELSYQCVLQGVQVRCIHSNPYKSLHNMIIETTPIMRELVKSVVNHFSILNYCGWHSDRSNIFGIPGPYHCAINNKTNPQVKEFLTNSNKYIMNHPQASPNKLLIPIGHQDFDRVNIEGLHYLAELETFQVIAVKIMSDDSCNEFFKTVRTRTLSKLHTPKSVNIAHREHNLINSTAIGTNKIGIAQGKS
jgi:hypothetical protein